MDTLPPPDPNSVPQRIDAEVDRGGLGAKGRELFGVSIARSPAAHAGKDMAALDDQIGVWERLRRRTCGERVGMGMGLVPRL